MFGYRGKIDLATTHPARPVRHGQGHREVPVAFVLGGAAVIVFGAALVDDGHAFLHGDVQQVIQHVLVARHLHVEALELTLELGHPLGVPGNVQHHLLNHPRTKFQRGLLGQVAAVAGGIERQATQARQAIADEEHHLALLLVGEVAQLHHKGGAFA